MILFSAWLKTTFSSSFRSLHAKKNHVWLGLKLRYSRDVVRASRFIYDLMYYSFPFRLHSEVTLLFFFKLITRWLPSFTFAIDAIYWDLHLYSAFAHVSNLWMNKISDYRCTNCVWWRENWRPIEDNDVSVFTFPVPWLMDLCWLASLSFFPGTHKLCLQEIL